MRRIYPAAVLLAVFACIPVTVNVNLFFDKLQEGLENRENAINEQSATPAEPEPAPPNNGGFLLIEPPVILMLAPAQEQGIDTNVDTPRMREIARARTERQRRLSARLAAGVLGEGNDGTWQIRSEEGLSREERADLRRDVTEENRDRQAELEEIRRANNLAESDLTRIRGVWVAARRQAILRGDSVPDSWVLQDDDGNWLTRGEWNERERQRGGGR